jgi:serine/threonine-protein kinase
MTERTIPARFADELEGTPYRQVRALAQGGMGEVHVVEHRMLGTSGVMKVIRAQLLDQEEALTKRLIVEARSLRRLRHPNLVEVLDFGFTAAGRAYLVTELLEGRTLKEELKERGRLPLAEALDIIDQTLAGLAVVHGGGVVHRDLKPDNLFYCAAPPGQRRTVKVLDFGVAKILTEEAKLRAGPVVATQEGMSIGTPLYMSPEQALGRQVDARADIYALGAILFHLLTGRPPFVRDSIAQVMEAHVTATIAPASLHDPALPAAVDAFISKAMEKLPDHRYVSAADMRAALGSLPRKPLISSRTEPLPSPRPQPSPMRSGADADTMVDASPVVHEPLRAPMAVGPNHTPRRVEPAPVAQKTRKMQLPALQLGSDNLAERSPSARAPIPTARAGSRFWSIALWIVTVLAAALLLTAVDRWLR